MYDENCSQKPPFYALDYSTNCDLRAALEKTLPEIVTRKEAANLTGGFLKAKTLANMDALKRGPARKIRIGRQVGYFKEDFIDFFIQQVK